MLCSLSYYLVNIWNAQKLTELLTESGLIWGRCQSLNCIELLLKILTSFLTFIFLTLHSHFRWKLVQMEHSFSRFFSRILLLWIFSYEKYVSFLIASYCTAVAIVTYKRGWGALNEYNVIYISHWTPQTVNFLLVTL